MLESGALALRDVLDDSPGQEHVAIFDGGGLHDADLDAHRGTVRTAPLYWYGSLVEGGRLRFAAGAVVEASAERGEEFLRSELGLTLARPGWARSLWWTSTRRWGGAASCSGNGLLDENASSHVAIGFG